MPCSNHGKWGRIGGSTTHIYREQGTICTSENRESESHPTSKRCCHRVEQSQSLSQSSVLSQAVKISNFCDWAELFQTPSDCRSQATLGSFAKKVDVWPKDQGEDEYGIEVHTGSK